MRWPIKAHDNNWRTQERHKWKTKKATRRSNLWKKQNGKLGLGKPLTYVKSWTIRERDLMLKDLQIFHWVMEILIYGHHHMTLKKYCNFFLGIKTDFETMSIEWHLFWKQKLVNIPPINKGTRAWKS